MVARVAPLLLFATRPSPRQLEQLRQELEPALAALAQLDAQVRVLTGQSRSRLAIRLEQARARSLHDPEALREVVALELERQQFTQPALAHDLAAREALTRCAAITQAITAVDLQ